ncbi:HTH-like domain-containing protein [Martelella radicis]|uniref:HTH-like domain-containing protein n=1 Tax=Martelella radicis TaxID=1397476 RepID=A0A7W6KR94_9HYPH|nr:DNA ligase [Martelella radicis]MBB4124640.1 hypothetical protein [Martelella radicis]
MNETQAAKILRSDYERSEARREQATAVHLFGIRYAVELVGLSLENILKRAEMPTSYKTEIRKGMKLARYVVLREP